MVAHYDASPSCLSSGVCLTAVSDVLVKVHAPGGHLLVLDLFGEVDDATAKATVGDDQVVFKLRKVRAWTVRRCRVCSVARARTETRSVRTVNAWRRGAGCARCVGPPHSSR